ncbi:hypothetical protein [Acinetobacter sp. TAC-1]|uniref:hypothetical protein n=1 Tax=Acinetobacter sp. TAC-1 TaxID=3027470 RepID=UPI0023AA5907|nr:hypothetical protein [Acinetobacter sp. TAC-1]WEE39364.1 hypothetical protein PYV58_21035 [Acinetobacter sp. TAC-1]
MKKFTIMAFMLCIYSTSQAAPNIWQDGFAQGFSYYLLENSQNQKLTISCNTGAGPYSDHSVELSKGRKEYASFNKQSFFSFIIDGKAFDAPSETRTRLNGNDWDKFIAHVGKAKKIEVFINNKKMAAFMPKNANKAFSKELVEACASLQFSSF